MPDANALPLRGNRLARRSAIINGGDTDAQAEQTDTSQPAADDGVEYSYDGKNYYRAAFQGNELVYVTGQP